MNHVLLIAVGNIGFRHFQALLNCSSSFDLYVVDFDDSAITRAKLYAADNANGRSIYYYSSLKDIDVPTAFHTAIIATSSIPRRAVFEELISLHTVKNIIFEKVLFPRVEDYLHVQTLLDKGGIAAYVNCIRRTADVYIALREELAAAKKIFFSMRGGDWGLACNSIHILDLFAFLTGAENPAVSCSGAMLEDKIFESKRSNYIEFYGKLVGKLNEQSLFSIDCIHGQSAAEIEIYTDTTYYCICESMGTILSQPLDGSKPADIRRFDLLPVSQTTNQVVDQLFSGQLPRLTAYRESTDLHVPILQEFIKKRNALIEKEEDLCPIT